MSTCNLLIFVTRIPYPHNAIRDPALRRFLEIFCGLVQLELLMRAFQKPLNNIYKQRLDSNLKYIQTLRKQEY